MIKLFKLSLKKTNDCIILVIPLVVFLSILSGYCSYALNSIDQIHKLFIALFTLFVMFCGFASSWLYMTKKALTLSEKIYLFEKDKFKDLLKLFYILPKGIGKLFLPIMGVVGIYIAVFTLAYFCSNYFISKYVGIINFGNFDFEIFALALKDFIALINELEPYEIKILETWYYVSLVITHIISFVTLLWIPEIIYGTKNPLRALYLSVKNLWKHIGNSIMLYIFIVFIIKALSILNTLLLRSSVLYFLVLLATYYFFVYIVVLLFTYYEQKFAKKSE